MNISDLKCYISGSDIDGIPRGKTVSATKLKSTLSLGFCNVIFAWDMVDSNYNPAPACASKDGRYGDLVAHIDLSTERRCPLTKIKHYLVDFYDNFGQPVPYCPRSLLKRIIATNPSWKPYTGVEFEFYNFKETQNSLESKQGVKLDPLTFGMFGYSMTRPATYQQYYDDIYDMSAEFDIPIECFHTETGPGVYEAALEYCDALKLADRAHLFKMLVRKIGIKHGITPCFMAKPYTTLPGCSGHIHLSLNTEQGENLFFDEADANNISQTLKYFLAGVLKGLPSIMAILAPNINSYKRLNANFWAPVSVSYGFEDRGSAIRIITPPVCTPKATRIEIRVPGADVNVYLANSAVLACGYFGINNKLALPEQQDANVCAPLPATLEEAVRVMADKGSLARTVLGDEFVDHFVVTRQHELRVYQTTVTDWEMKRYMETV